EVRLARESGEVLFRGRAFSSHLPELDLQGHQHTEERQAHLVWGLLEVNLDRPGSPGPPRLLEAVADPDDLAQIGGGGGAVRTQVEAHACSSAARDVDGLGSSRNTPTRARSSESFHVDRLFSHPKRPKTNGCLGSGLSAGFLGGHHLAPKDFK